MTLKADIYGFTPNRKMRRLLLSTCSRPLRRAMETPKSCCLCAEHTHRCAYMSVYTYMYHICLCTQVRIYVCVHRCAYMSVYTYVHKYACTWEFLFGGCRGGKRSQECCCPCAQKRLCLRIYLLYVFGHACTDKMEFIFSFLSVWEQRIYVIHTCMCEYIRATSIWSCLRTYVQTRRLACVIRCCHDPELAKHAFMCTGMDACMYTYVLSAPAIMHTHAGACACACTCTLMHVTSIHVTGNACYKHTCYRCYKHTCYRCYKHTCYRCYKHTCYGQSNAREAH